ncbi:MAG: hypothetical protein QF752_11485 [Planctomycetota bacterium]|jgi:hypothetical protein|nr:hypothetical protein [Planctomycetota bacterium]
MTPKPKPTIPPLFLPLLLLISFAPGGCKSLGDPGPLSSPPETTAPDPARLTRFLAEIRQLMFQAQIHRLQGPHDLILEQKTFYRLVRKTPSTESVVIGSLPIPPELELVSSPPVVRFHREGHFSWSGPDVTDITSPTTKRGDITVRLRGTNQYGFIDLVPKMGRVQLLIKSFR